MSNNSPNDLHCMLKVPIFYSVVFLLRFSTVGDPKVEEKKGGIYIIYMRLICQEQRQYAISF